jgi:hypothetical protein
MALMVAVMVAFDLAIVMLPDFSRAALTAWRNLTVGGNPWTGIAARTGVALGGTALGAGALVAFVRGVRTAPFVWLTPVLVGFASMVMAHMPIVLPLPVSAPAYALASAFFLLGGGTLVQTGRRAHMIVGTLVILLPLALLAGSQVAAPAVASGFRSADAKLFVFVLAVCSVGVELVAFMTPSASDLFGLAQFRRAHKRELAAALHGARMSDERATLAEQSVAAAQASLRIQGAELEAALALQDEAAVLVGRRRSAIYMWCLCVATLASMGLLLVGYFQMYQPLVRRAHAQVATASQQQREHGAAMQALRAQWETEARSLRDDAATARSEAASAKGDVSKLQGEWDAYKAELATAATTSQRGTVPPARAQRSPSHRQVTARAVRARAVRARAEAASPTTPATPAPARHAKPGVNEADDPIGGLGL